MDYQTWAVAFVASWNEELHPRDSDGRFTDGRGRAKVGGWGLKEFPETLPPGHPLLVHTDGIKTPEREKLRNEIAEKMLDGVTPPAGRRPRVTFMGGGGASGKGGVREMLERDGQIPVENRVRLDPDEIKNEIPEYHQIIDAGDSRAARMVHYESADIGQRVQDRAIERGLDVVNDVTLGRPDDARALLSQFKDAEYDVHLVGVTADPVTAVERNASRAEETGRYVPVDVQLEAHKGFSQGFLSYLDHVDSAELWDTNSDPARKIVEKFPNGEVVVYDEDAFEAFKRKSLLNPQASSPANLYP